MKWYKLNDDHSITLVGNQPSTVEDCGWKRVALTKIGWFNNRCAVSTVFLSLDHAYNGEPPLVFETMVFGGPLDQEQERYSTWEEAIDGHAKMVARVRSLN